MNFILFCEMRPPDMNDIHVSVRHTGYIRIDILFASTSASRVLIYDGSICHGTLLDAFLHPQIRLDIFFCFILVCLDQMLENVCVGIGQDDLSRLRGSRRITTGVLHQVAQDVSLYTTPEPFHLNSPISGRSGRLSCLRWQCLSQCAYG